MTIDALPSALGDLKMCCDTCAKKKGEMLMTASVYCVPCGMKYCNDHHKVCSRPSITKDFTANWPIAGFFQLKYAKCKMYMVVSYQSLILLFLV